ncbi:hypothetical protein [Thermofilum pendens]|uniref:hypothetical protein n=1 Tax=Thermofilum pendens TaxID=2269 RepID=UPI00069A1AA9|nr:hypothetical protein [Thermofilum pendens]
MGWTALRAALSRRIEEEFPGLEGWEEGLMLGVCEKDFLNYVCVEKGFGGPGEAYAYVEGLAEEKPAEFASILGDWFDLWAAKWRQRVWVAPRGAREEGPSVLEELPAAREARRLALALLIRRGEVCFTDALASAAVRGALARIASRMGVGAARRVAESDPQMLAAEVERAVKEIASRRGPLVLVKPW